MGPFSSFSRRTVLLALSSMLSLASAAFAGNVTISSPAANATFPGAVPIAAQVSEKTPYHIEVWDNGRKLGDFFSTSVAVAPVLAAGQHTLTVLAVASTGRVLDANSVRYQVASKRSPMPLPVPVPPIVPPPGPPAAGGVRINSPEPNSTSISAVTIDASAIESGSYHLEVWDNGAKLGEVPAKSVHGVYVLPNGAHVLTVQAVRPGDGTVISRSSVNYNVAEACTTSATAQCDLDQVGVDNVQNVCLPKWETSWVANPCGGGVQGLGGSFPRATGVSVVSEPGVVANQGNSTLNGHSLHLSEVQGGGGYSNVLFRGQTPELLAPTSNDSHWTLDEYVYVPDPTAHQALEMDAQVSIHGVWTKFYTECAFNMKAGTGYWAVFDSATGGWIFLNGQEQNGQVPPVVPCNRSQFAQPWAGSSDPGFTGWHHVTWSFLRNPDGTVTFQTLTFDATTTTVNFHPNSATGGSVGDNGNFGALIQLDGALNSDGLHDNVDVYISEMSLFHTL